MNSSLVVYGQNILTLLYLKLMMETGNIFILKNYLNLMNYLKYKMKKKLKIRRKLKSLIFNYLKANILLLLKMLTHHLIIIILE